MNRTRKSSPRTFKMEPTGPKVPSRYLTGPTGSRHDHCKQTTDAKPINPLPKRVPKPPADRLHIDATNSVPRMNKSPSISPKTTTRNIKNNNVVKDQTLKKDIAVEPKKRDFKLKSMNSQAKTYNLPSSRTPRRSLSAIFVPDKDMSLPTSRFPKRRLSEISVHPNTDIASVSNGSRGSGINKNESRRDSKTSLVNKKTNSVKTTVSTSKISVKVSPLRTYKSPQKPELRGSRKSKTEKPIVEFELEETLHVIEPNNSLSQNLKSPDCSPSRSEVKAMKNDQNGVVESSPLPTEDDTPAKDGQPSSFELKAIKDDQNEVVESSPPTMEDDTHAKDDKKSMEDDNLAQDDLKGVLESSPPSMEDDTLAKDDQNEVMESSPPSMEDDTLAKDGPLLNSEVEAKKNDQNSMVEPSTPSMEDDTLAKDGEQNDKFSESEVNDTKQTTYVGKLVVETNDSSLEDPRFCRGTILSPESDNHSLIELQFKKGKELENETETGEHVCLRRLSSDGVVCISESVSISVDLKHQEMEEKKAAVLINNVIEEAASKLIETRKSKVKALVGAFETIVSGETPRSYTSRST